MEALTRRGDYMEATYQEMISCGSHLPGDEIMWKTLGSLMFLCSGMELPGMLEPEVSVEVEVLEDIDCASIEI